MMRIYQPITFRSVRLHNRMVLSPMCLFSAEEGLADDFHLVHYGSRAQGGVGLVMVEATAVLPEGRITPKCLGLWNENQQEALKRVVDFVHFNSQSKIGIQLSHAGRKASVWNGKLLQKQDGGWDTVAPSPIPYAPEDDVPHVLSEADIKVIIQEFKNSAVRAVKAGFDVIELHAAHGYLIHQFLSPKSNNRSDDYGGSFENRIRFLLEIITAINEVIDDSTALFVRVSGSEYSAGGWDVEDNIRLAKYLKGRNVDLVDVSSGGNVHGVAITLFNSYQVPFSQAIKQKSGIRTGAVGLIDTIEEAESILNNEEADLIFLGRLLLRNPYFPVLSSFDLDEICPFPQPYAKGIPEK